MEFSMRLNSVPFSMIASGNKTIEMRLYDEKRQKIAIGDTICFTDVSDATRVLHTKVKDVANAATPGPYCFVPVILVGKDPFMDSPERGQIHFMTLCAMSFVCTTTSYS